MTLNYMTICSGIETPSVAWQPLNWNLVAVSEIEKFPNAVLKHHYPHVPNYGDMTKFKEWPDVSVNLICGGTPCQSFSVAGLRKGLADPRGNLTLTYLAIADRYRPLWLVWENVPGVLSIDDGRAFGALLGGMAELGYGFAYRVLDAQFFGVPQRRRRVFVIGYFGDWRRAAAVLFERHSLSGNSSPRRQARKNAPCDIREGIAGSLGSHKNGGWDVSDIDGAGAYIPNVANPLTHRMEKGINTTCDEGQTMIAEIAPPLMAKVRRQPGTDPDDVTALIPMAYDTRSGMAPHGSMKGEEISPTLRGKDTEPPLVTHALTGEGFDASEDGTGRGTPIIETYGLPGNWIGRKPENGGNAVEPMHDIPPNLTVADRHCVAFGSRDSGLDAAVDISPTLRSGSHDKSHANSGVPPAIAFNITPSNSNKDYNARESEKSQSITTNGNNPSARGGDLIVTTQVRRLTPLECERLQGMPDGYTDIPYGGGRAKDGPRYKALGNGMAMPCMSWLGRRINLVHQIKGDEHAQM